MIGEHITEGLRATEIIQLENRSIELVLTSLPRVFSEKLDIKEFVELNGLIVSGSKSVVDELRLNIKQIDKVVPLVQIEVIIVQYNKSYDIQSGLKAGLDKINQTQTSGVLFPTTDMTLNNTSVNSLIDAFNGLGFIKLGKVTDAFYLNLKLLNEKTFSKIVFHNFQQPILSIKILLTIITKNINNNENLNKNIELLENINFNILEQQKVVQAIHEFYV